MPENPARIDREAVVRRHHVVLEKADLRTPINLGLPSPAFVFTADVTGLQSLVSFHAKGQQLNTMADWAWHEFPNPENFTLADTTAPHPHGDGSRPYSPMTVPAGLTKEKADRWPAAAAWLRANPQRFPLGTLGLVLDGKALDVADLSEIKLVHNLWEGRLDTSFKLAGETVKVSTTVFPSGIASRIESKLLVSGRLGFGIHFPGPSDTWGGTTSDKHPEQHRSELIDTGRCSVLFRRTLDEKRYHAAFSWNQDGRLTANGAHRWRLEGIGSPMIELNWWFDISAGFRPFDGLARDCALEWARYWNECIGMVDFSGSKDPRAIELERRIILSLYQTAIHCAGVMPPQETGLAQNSWFGKFHMEMLPWHIAQFALWGRVDDVVEKLDFYQKTLPQARATAAAQGCMGARWPKMTDPSGRESPSDIGVFLAWQQPHPIYLAELARRVNPGREGMENLREIVYATADFMASFPQRGKDGKLHLMPPLIPAQECYNRAKTSDPAFELAYFRWALGIARQWREALDEAPDPMWDRAWRDLAPLPLVEDRYATVSGPPFTLYHDHPCVLMICGCLPPGEGFDMKRFSSTFDDIRKKWDWPTTWGWDPPVMALAAARLGRPADAVDELLRDTPKNGYLANGHNYQDQRLPLYLPGNGGLLLAVAAMLAGWDGAPDRKNPGFPDDGSWDIRWEGLRPIP